MTGKSLCTWSPPFQKINKFQNWPPSPGRPQKKLEKKMCKTFARHCIHFPKRKRILFENSGLQYNNHHTIGCVFLRINMSSLILFICFFTLFLFTGKMAMVKILLTMLLIVNCYFWAEAGCLCNLSRDELNMLLKEASDICRLERKLSKE